MKTFLWRKPTELFNKDTKIRSIGCIDMQLKITRSNSGRDKTRKRNGGMAETEWRKRNGGIGDKTRNGSYGGIGDKTWNCIKSI